MQPTISHRRPARLWAAVFGLALLVSFAPDARAVTVEDVLTLTRLNIDKTEIIKAIEKDRTVFNLGVQDILRLRKEGVDSEVIKFMLQTPQKYGGKGGAATTAPSATAAPAAARQQTPEERAAEEARLRREAQRLKEEQMKAQEAQRRAYAQGILKRGKDQADGGEFVAAIQTFQRFLQEGRYAPGSEEYVIARYGVANALVQAGLYQAASETLVEVLLAGPQTQFFQPAFSDFRTLRKKVGYSPPELERLAAFDVSAFSQGFQD